MSEDWWSVARYGMMAFGGAGAFLSIALAKVMDANYDDCRKYSDTGSGDVGVMECVYKYTETKLTHNTALHQIDLPGDVSGIYESGHLSLSLHHWKRGWWDESNGPDWPIANMHLVADVCGDCFLQRWQFGKDMILSNGYSIATYPTGALDKFEVGIDLSKVEQTWGETNKIEESVNRGSDHDIGRTRPKLELEKDKLQYRFLHAVSSQGGVRQFYYHYGLEGDHDTLVELYWTRSPQVRTRNSASHQEKVKK